MSIGENIKTTDTIISVYKLIVYASGRIETIQQPLDYIFNDLESETSIFNPSSRMRQIIAVIEKVTNSVLKNDRIGNLDGESLNKLVSKACYDVAAEEKLTVPSISDKLTRQLALQKGQFANLLLEFYKEIFNGKIETIRDDINITKLRSKLLACVSKNSKNDDYDFINYSLDKISNIICSEKGE